jgi:hypothetical protein
MTSWRDSASIGTQADLDGLVDSCLRFATQMLDAHGEFYPFGASVSPNGEVSMIGGDPGQGERPASADVLSTMVAGLRRDRDTVRAVAVVADVRMADSDAVRVELEHREGLAIQVLLPYRKKRMRRGIEYGAITAGPGTHQVWSA